MTQTDRQTRKLKQLMPQNDVYSHTIKKTALLQKQQGGSI